jgi:hypothetical protein
MWAQKDERGLWIRESGEMHIACLEMVRGEGKVERSSALGEVITALVTVEELHAIPEHVHLRRNDA